MSKNDGKGSLDFSLILVHSAAKKGCRDWTVLDSRLYLAFIIFADIPFAKIFVFRSPMCTKDVSVQALHIHMHIPISVDCTSA